MSGCIPRCLLWYHPCVPTGEHNTRPMALEFIGDLYRLPFILRADRPTTIGRAAESDVILLGETVSRRHASVIMRGPTPFLTDLGSTHGTLLNSLRVDANRSTPLTPGDLIQVGPFMLRVIVQSDKPSAGPSTIALQDDATTAFHVQTLASVSPHAGKRLRALTECIAKLDAAKSVMDAVEIGLTYALDGSGYGHAAILRKTTESEVEVTASKRLDGGGFPSQFSRSLITAAESGKTAVLAPQQRVASNSLIGMNVHSALCAPIHVGESIAAFLYLDAREREAPVDPDAAGFCDALATALGLSLANISRADLERRQNTLTAELTAAHEAQQFILPESEGSSEFLRYGMQMRPGAYVAGDLFDVVPLDDGRVAVAIGDVAGHGAGSAMLMASAQSHLNAQLQVTCDPAAALAAVNAYLASKALGGRFVSLWVGVFSKDGTVEYVDAGHGHWLHITKDGRTPQSPITGGSIPVGVAAGIVYESSTFKLIPGDRILLYTDGVIEQKNRDGELFGIAGLTPITKKAIEPAEMARTVIETVVRHSMTGSLDDDATVACLEYKLDEI